MPWLDSAPRRAGVLGLWLFLAVLLIAGMGRFSFSPGTSLFVRLASHTLLAGVLQFPWNLGAAMVKRDQGAAFEPRWPSLLLSASIALLLPWLHGTMLVQRETQAVAELLGKMKLASAWPRVVGLCDLGSTEAIGAVSPVTLRGQLKENLAILTARTKRPLTAGSSGAERIERARDLAMLGQLAAAGHVLRPLPADHLTATLLRAGICQDQGELEVSDAHYRKALVLLKTDATKRDTVLPTLISVYDGLAYNARAAGRPAEAEAIYGEALAQLPAAQAHFHFQLGRHYRLAGRPSAALDHLRIASTLDPALAIRARPLQNELTSQTPGCFLRWLGTSRP